jgi:hypothetical protein
MIVRPLPPALAGRRLLPVRKLATQAEDNLARALGPRSRRILGSGCRPDFRGDVETPGWLAECKWTQKARFELLAVTLAKAQHQARVYGRHAFLELLFLGTEPGVPRHRGTVLDAWVFLPVDVVAELIVPGKAWPGAGPGNCRRPKLLNWTVARRSLWLTRLRLGDMRTYHAPRSIACLIEFTKMPQGYSPHWLMVERELGLHLIAWQQRQQRKRR